MGLAVSDRGIETVERPPSTEPRGAGISAFLLVASAGIGVVLQMHYWKRLPQRVASHFSGSGIADGWMGRDAHLALSVGVFVTFTLMFAGIAVLMRKLPAKWINIPNREHWLSEQNRERSRRYLAAWSNLFGVLVNSFMIVAFHLVFLANLSDPARLDNKTFFVALGVLLIATTVGVIALLLRFSGPE
jgi:uncharacterized membrane protein